MPSGAVVALRPAAKQSFSQDRGVARRRSVDVVGSLVLNRFQLEEKLGSGGFGTVWKAWDPRLERHVAVKVLATEGDAGRRVVREAQAAARLNHAGIVTLYELGEEAGQAYLVSELVRGSTLRALCLEGRLSDRDVAEIGADLCEALDHAHAKGVVHRDIKPQNVMVCEHEPRAKLADFGIARLLDAEALTATGSVVGTIAYMAPEQAEGMPAGPPADVYSLALTLYECWTGENPNVRPTPAATARAVGSPVPSIRRLRPDLPQRLTEAIDASLEPDPCERPSLELLGTRLEGSLDLLDAGEAVPAPGAGGARLLRRLAGCDAADVGAAAAIAGFTAAAMLAPTPGGPPWALTLPLAAALLALLRPRLGYLVAAIGLVAWFAAVGRPGTAVVLGVATIPPGLLVRRGERGLMAPALAPALGAASVAPAFPLLAALAPTRRDRAVLSATGFLWLSLAEVALSRDLLLGAPVEPARGWQGSASSGLTEVLQPLLTTPAFLAGLAIFTAAALLAGVLLAPVRGRIAGSGRPSGYGLADPRPAAAAAGGVGGRHAGLS
jgi:hypothetical protein